MIDLIQTPEDELGQTQKYLRREFINRGWHAEIPYAGSAIYFLTRSDGKKLRMFSSTPPTTSFAAARLANDKFATYQVLKETSVPQLSTMTTNINNDIDEAVGFMRANGTVVVKPVDGGHGKGITVNVTEEAALKDAVATALPENKYIHSAIIQKQYMHEKIFDIRVLTIGYEYVAAVRRVEARVFGDGQHTVRQLIEIENETPDRGKAYRAKLTTIDVEKAASYLKDKIDNVPAVDEEYQVLGIANYGAGGETVDVTDDLPDWLIQHALDASRACELPVAGVDFMLAGMPHKDSSQTDLDAALTEINKAPLLSMHSTPTIGKTRNIEAVYLDYLDSLEWKP